jgi:hypothetical protein
MAEGRTVSLSNGRSTTSEQMVAEMKRDPHAPFEVRILRTRPDGLRSDPTLRAGPQFPRCLQRGMNSNLVAFNFIGEYREPT